MIKRKHNGLKPSHAGSVRVREAAAPALLAALLVGSLLAPWLL